MTGTVFPNGVSVVKNYAGSTGVAAYNATTKVVKRTAVIRCDAQTSETTTGLTMPATAVITDCYINVITVDATETVDVGTAGTSNDPNGLLAAASLATAGVVRGTTTVTTGCNNTFVASTTKGALLATLVAGADVTNGGDGSIEYHNCVTASSDPITYTCSAGSDTAVFDIIIEYIELV